MDIMNPKRAPRSESGRAMWYPYYAGYSAEFASRFLASVETDEHSLLLDPWNGSGTSTWAANVLGIRSIGLDLNPVMSIVAQARLLSRREVPSLIPLSGELTESLHSESVCDTSDPLREWFAPSAASLIRNIEQRIRSLLVDPGSQMPARLSSIAAFYYVALFRLVRELTQRFVGSNPTWVRRPSSSRHRVRPNAETIRIAFANEVATMTAALTACEDLTDADVRLIEGSSRDIPLADNSVDLILSSPPYCTRIDYAITTLRELAVLGVGSGAPLKRLRSEMIGTSTVSRNRKPVANSSWGPTCTRFLHSVWNHESKSSRSYYHRNLVQYFEALFASFQDISRVLKPGGTIALVVQDSYYKELHNDLPAVTQEMLTEVGIHTVTRRDYPQGRSIAQINTGRRRRDVSATESVIVAQQ